MKPGEGRTVFIIAGEQPRCPSCLTRLGRIESNGRALPPKPGDWNVCAACRAVLRFIDARLNCRVATLAEFEHEVATEQLSADAELIEFVRRCFAARAARTGGLA